VTNTAWPGHNIWGAQAGSNGGGEASPGESR